MPEDGLTVRLLRIALLAGCLLLLDSTAARAARPYRVDLGESLWAIAIRYRVPLGVLLRANGMRHPHQNLAYGTRIIIPNYAAGPLEATARQRRTMPLPLSELVPRRAGAAAAALPPARMLAAGAPASRGIRWGASLIAAAVRYLGVPYRWGGASPAGFDCSGFISFVFAAVDVGVPRTTEAMWLEGAPVGQDRLRVGDVVFFATTRPGPSHAGIYIGRGLMVHAASGFGRVRVTSLDYPYYQGRYIGARRF